MRKHIYADESGNFDFRESPGASRYFILTTVVMEDDSTVASALLDLRRELAWKGYNLQKGFHAAADKQFVRDAVFNVLQSQRFRIDATILEKRKSQPQVRHSEIRFYKYAWFYHMKHVAHRVANRHDEMLVVAASVGTKQKAATFSNAVKDVTGQVSATRSAKSVAWTAASDHCLQVADYCSWALQRKWERGDSRSYQRIHQKMVTEYDLFRSGRTYYY